MSKLTQAPLTVVPGLLIAVSFILLLIIQLGGSSLSTLSNVYFLQIDVGGQDVYRLYLWNYCSNTSTNGVKTVGYCSSRTPGFSFDPNIIPTITSLESRGTIQVVFGAYHSAMSWMWAAHLVAFVSTLICVMACVAALYSRYARHLAFFSAMIAELCATTATITSTVVFSQLSYAIKNTQTSSSITSSTSSTMLGLGWTSAVLLNLSAVIYILSAFCLRDPDNKDDLSKDGFEPAFPTAFSDSSSSSLRNLKPLTLADKLHCEKLSSIIQDKSASRRDSSFSFIDSAARRPRDSFMSRISDHLVQNSRSSSQSSFRSTQNLEKLNEVPTTTTKGHLGTKVLVAAGQGRKSVVFAMDKNKFDVYDQRKTQTLSITSETDSPISPSAAAGREILFDAEHDVNTHDDRDELQDLEELISPIWSQRDPASHNGGQTRSNARARRDELVTDSIRAGPWANSPAAKRKEKAKEEVRRKRWSNASLTVDEKDNGVLGREWR